MRRLQLLLGDPSRDRGPDPEPFPQGLDHMHDAELEDGFDFDRTGTLDHRCAVRLGQNPPDAGHQPLEYRPIQLVGTTEAVHHPGLDMALLGMPRVLGQRVVAHHAAVLVPPLGRSKIHAHPDSMFIQPNRAQTGNPCAHIFLCRNSRPPNVELRDFNDLPGRRRPNPPEICPTTANSGQGAPRAELGNRSGFRAAELRPPCPWYRARPTSSTGATRSW